MTAIKLSAPDWCFYPKLGDPAQYYETVRGLGIEGVEMVDPSRYPLARAAGLEIVTMSGPGMTRGMNRQENHTELIPELRDAVYHAAENHIPILIVFSGNRSGQGDDQGIVNCRIGFEAVLPDAEKAGVILGFELLNTSDHPDYQADRGKYGFELAKAISNPWFKLVYDIYHTERMGDNSAFDVVHNLAAIAHLHTAEYPLRSFPEADGNIRYSQIVPTIVKAGYRGYWGLEYIPGAKPLDELRKTVSLFQRLAGN